MTTHNDNLLRNGDFSQGENGTDFWTLDNVPPKIAHGDRGHMRTAATGSAGQTFTVKPSTYYLIEGRTQTISASGFIYFSYNDQVEYVELPNFPFWYGFGISLITPTNTTSVNMRLSATPGEAWYDDMIVYETTPDHIKTLNQDLSKLNNGKAKTQESPDDRFILLQLKKLNI